MKRYRLESTVKTEYSPFDERIRRHVDSVMVEDPNGEFVSFCEIAPTIKALEERIPEVRIARLEAALGLIEKGCCPECGRKVADWKAPFGGFAPEAWATLKEAGIDPGTGHRFGCSRIHRV